MFERVSNLANFRLEPRDTFVSFGQGDVSGPLKAFELTFECEFLILNEEVGPGIPRRAGTRTLSRVPTLGLAMASNWHDIVRDEADRVLPRPRPISLMRRRLLEYVCAGNRERASAIAASTDWAVKMPFSAATLRACSSFA